MTISKEPRSLNRTEWAERHVEDFLSLPLVREFVFRSPQASDRGIQKEVVDFLIAHGESAILISQKCQENPLARNGTKVSSWAKKAAKGAASQLCGALRTSNEKEIWCEHSRRGRVQFPHGLPKIDHAIVMVEVFERVELNQFDLDTAYFPLNFNETPISYFSGNDFLNLVVALRTTSDLLAYLNARRLLPPSDLHVIGDEKSLFEFYLLNGGTFEGCASRRDVTIAVSEQQDRLKDILATKRESDSYSGLLEDVADKLATRLPDYASNLPQHLLASFDPPDARAGYLEMQRILTGLRLRERAELGRSFYSVVDKVANETNTFTYRSAYLDLHPAWVFVFAASRGIDREEVLSRNTNLMRGAVAFYGKNCLLVTDRDGANYEVGIARQGSSPTTDEQEIGRRFFGHLRITDVSLDRV